MSKFRQWLKQPRLGAYVAALGAARAAFEYSRKASSLALLATAVAAGGVAAEPGVGDDKILFGQSAAFEGPAAALGVGVREGILAAFLEANASGGVHGRRLGQLIPLLQKAEKVPGRHDIPRHVHAVAPTLGGAPSIRRYR